MPKPYIAISPDQEYVEGWEFKPNTNVTITIDGIVKGSDFSDSDGYVWFSSGLGDIVAGDVVLVNDGFTPRNSDDKSHGAYGNWPRSGTQWVEYAWSQPISTKRIDVYWFDDQGGCRLPKSWKLLAKVGGEWKEVANPSGYGVAGDQFNTCTFDPVRVEGLRLDVQLPEKAAMGIHEWVVR